MRGCRRHPIPFGCNLFKGCGESVPPTLSEVIAEVIMKNTKR